MIKRFFLLAAFIMMCACGRTSMQQRDAVLENIRTGDYAAALKLAESDRYFNEDSSALIKSLDIAALQYHVGSYEQSAHQFSLAKDMADELYTKSVTKMLAANIGGDGITDYRGERHELAAIRFYQSLAHYKMAMQSENAWQRKRNAESAFAAVADWNAYMRQFDQSDMLARALGAWFSAGGPAADRQRAAGFRMEMDRISKKSGSDISGFTHDGNVAIIVKQGIIPQKVAVTDRFPLVLTGDLQLAVFLLGSGVGIDYEYATVPPLHDPPKIKIIVVSKDGNTVADKALPLMYPLAKMAYVAYEEGKTAMKAAKIARLTAKYIAAVTAANALYDNNKEWTKLAAMASFAISAQLIQASEYADLRQWNTLPANIYMQTIKLDPGEYTVNIYIGDNIVGMQKLAVLHDMPTMADIYLPGVY